MRYEFRCWIKVAYIGLCNSFPHFYKRWWGRNWIGLSNCRNVMQKVTYKYALNRQPEQEKRLHMLSARRLFIQLSRSFEKQTVPMHLHRHCLLFDNSAWNYSNLGYKIFQSKTIELHCTEEMFHSCCVLFSLHAEFT